MFCGGRHLVQRVREPAEPAEAVEAAFVPVVAGLGGLGVSSCLLPRDSLLEEAFVPGRGGGCGEVPAHGDHALERSISESPPCYIIEAQGNALVAEREVELLQRLKDVCLVDAVQEVKVLGEGLG